MFGCAPDFASVSETSSLVQWSEVLLFFVFFVLCQSGLQLENWAALTVFLSAVNMEMIPFLVCWLLIDPVTASVMFLTTLIYLWMMWKLFLKEITGSTKPSLCLVSGVSLSVVMEIQLLSSNVHFLLMQLTRAMGLCLHLHQIWKCKM